MNLVVEDNVPVPASRGRHRSEMIKTLMAMKPGQSVVVPFGRGKLGGRLATIKRHGLEYTTEAVDAGSTRVFILANPTLDPAP